VSTWILLRGLTRETRHWGDFPQIFKECVANANVIAVDLPGNGMQHALRSPTRVADMAEHCRAELARLGVTPPYNIVAMSLGAMVAVAWAAQYPQEVARCVLINTSMRPFSPFYRRLRPANYLALLKLALIGGSSRDWEETILRLTSNVRNDVDVLPAWIAYRMQCPVSRGNAWRQLIAAARYRAPVTKPHADILILTSLNDRLVDTRCSSALASTWEALLIEHPSAGHDIPLDDASWVAQQIRDWLVRAQGVEEF
jgi:pimeloyl-ACP methyl ester carboxylesterase